MMSRTIRPFYRLALATAIGLTGLIATAPAHAQVDGSFTYDSTNSAYFVTGDASITGDISDKDVFVGKDNATGFNTLTGPFTLTVGSALDGTTSAVITSSGNDYPIGAPNTGYYFGLNTFGSNSTNIAGGYVFYSRGFDTSTTTVSNSTVSFVQGQDNSAVNILSGDIHYAEGFGSATISIFGGSVSNAVGYQNSAVSIFGGTVHDARAYENSTINMTGGTISQTFFAGDTSTANVSGGLFNGGIVLFSDTTLNLTGNFATAVGNEYLYYFDGDNHLVRDYTITGTLGDGTVFQQTIKAAANSVSLGTNNIQLRGNAFDVAADRYVVNDESVTGNYNAVVIGRSGDGATSTSPTVDLQSGLNTAHVTVHNDSEVTVEGGFIRNRLTALDTSAVTITGGDAESVIGYDESTINFLGGEVGTIRIFDNGEANISGSNLSTAYSNGSSVMNFAGGDNNFANSDDTSEINLVAGSLGYIRAEGSSSVNILGGNVDSLEQYDNSIGKISGGTLTNLYAFDNSSVDISGGSVTDIFGFDNSTITITGGTISQNTLRFFDAATLNLFGTDLGFTSTGSGSDDNGTYTGYSLSGVLQDGQSISGVSLYDYSNAGSWTGGGNRLSFVSNVAVVPEPSTLGLMGMMLCAGTAVLLASRRRFQGRATALVTSRAA